MLKKPKRQTFEDSINKTNPITLLKDFLTGVYTIIDDLLTIYVSVYNVLDKLTDNTVCNTTIPEILNNICKLEDQINSLFIVFKELPNIIANSPELSFISFQLKFIKTVITTLFGTLDALKDKLLKDLGIPLNVNICTEGTLLTNKVCVHLQKASDNKILLFIKKVGKVLVTFKRWFNTLEPIFKLEKIGIGDFISAGQNLTTNLTPEIADISNELNTEVNQLKEDIKQTSNNVIQKGGYNFYNFIINPDTNERYYLNSPKGINLLQRYRNYLDL